MKFAIFENSRIEATKGVKGVCPICGSELIAKCGEFKSHHWSHKSIRSCDPWWEPETEWHRSWKNKFPSDWQEKIKYDEQTGEKHIADVCTSHGLVIEFQHSHIDPQERVSREKFYKPMVWVVDGTRLRRDSSRFFLWVHDFHRTQRKGYYFVEFPDKCFPSSWLGSFVPVLFDFRGMETIDNPKDLKNYLYCLLPKQNNLGSILMVMTRESFISKAINGEIFRELQEQKSQIVNPPIQNNSIRRSGPTYDINPRTGQFVKRRRF